MNHDRVPAMLPVPGWCPPNWCTYGQLKPLGFEDSWTRESP